MERAREFPQDHLPQASGAVEQLGSSANVLQNLLTSVPRTSAFNRVAPGPAAPPMFSDLNLVAHLQPHPEQLMQQLLAQAGAGLGLLGMSTQPSYPLEMPQSQSARQAHSAEVRTTTNSYASRHQQAEARRRSRINERLDALRKIVPHTERANTALFLEDVVRYVQRLQHRVFELETKLGLAPTVNPLPSTIKFGEGCTSETTAAAASAPVMRTVNGGGEGGYPRSDASRQTTLPIPSKSVAISAKNLKATGGSPSMQDIGANAPTQGLLPSVSEELAMAAQLAPEKADPAAAEGETTMAESQPELDVVSRIKPREVSNTRRVEGDGDNDHGGGEGIAQRAKRVKKAP